jgi:hypothetical protein
MAAETPLAVRVIGRLADEVHPAEPNLLAMPVATRNLRTDRFEQTDLDAPFTVAAATCPCKPRMQC